MVLSLLIPNRLPGVSWPSEWTDVVINIIVIDSLFLSDRSCASTKKKEEKHRFVFACVSWEITFLMVEGGV